MKTKSFITLILLFVIGQSILNAQRVRVPNNPNYDLKKYHFGFMLGLNQMNFVIKPIENIKVFDTLYGIESTPEQGFNIGIVADLRLNEYMNLRFIPSLAFGERTLNYFIKIDNHVIANVAKKVESTYIEFPLELKLRSQRMINSRAYVIGGAKYCIDLASQEKKKDDDNVYQIKLQKHDLQFQIGVGFDFYLVYFKLGTELKMCYGINDLLIRENNIYTDGIQNLKTKMFQFSVTFE